MSASALTRPQSYQLFWLLLHYRGLLIASTRIEIAKKYAASSFGLAWVVLYPLMLLGIYLFVFAVIFPARVAEFSGVGYAVFVFSGMVPFLGFVETFNSSTLCIKQNIHLVKNVIMPIELIPIRTTIVAMVPQMTGLLMLLVLDAVTGHMGWKVLALPVVLIFDILMLFGIALIMGSLGVLLPDLAQVSGLITTALFFLSPIAFPPEIVPPMLKGVLLLNPVHYLIAGFRWSLLDSYPVNPRDLALFAAVSVGMFVVGAAVFHRVKSFMADYE